MSSRLPDLKSAVAALRTSSGVYLFYGPQEELLYVGKSVNIRARVRSHFRDRSERMMMRRVRRIETRETAGELGALLLESKLIKELRPMYNVASKQKRRIILALRKVTPEGYHAVTLKAVDTVEPKRDPEILGVFKHFLQAKEFLATVARTHGLCGKLIGLERARTFCFSYHLHQCAGACMGEEAPEIYNKRLEAAFEGRRISGWPFQGGIIVEEGKGKGRRDLFLIDNWVLSACLMRKDRRMSSFVPVDARFDYDTYRLLYAFVMKPGPERKINPVKRDEWERLLTVAGTLRPNVR